ncbi:hypothetical protein [Tropicimonas marinistellae]|uniref:hypothetical protein n=1 Tax=Tropicimonas marinistellae TaxID=1739787 RepID=UPI00122DF77F|nr:hypothetical protein [Tropicimonas marinistellae]
MSAAQMASFTVPGAGPFLAAGISVAQAIFDIFYTGDSSMSPGDMNVTANQLTQVKNDILAGMRDNSLHDDLSNHFDVIDTLFSDNLAQHWNDAAAGKGPAFVGDMSKTAETDWVNDMNADLRAPITGTSPILQAATFCKTHPSIKYDSLALFIYAGTAYALFCKINVMWEYSRIVRAHDYAQAMRDKANQSHVAAYRKWMQADKATRGPAPTLPPAVEALLPKDEIEQQSHYVQLIHDKMDQLFIPYLESVIDDLQKEFMDAHNEFCARANQITVTDVAGLSNGGSIIDTGTNRRLQLSETQSPGGYPFATLNITGIDDDGFNEHRGDVYLGGIRAEVYYRRIQAQKLQDFTVPVRLQHKAVLKHWKECRDNAAKFLADYPVPKNQPMT